MKIAVLGTGSVGSRHLVVLRDANVADLMAIPCRTERLAQWEAAGFQGAADLKTAVSHGVSALIVATDSARHLEDALMGLRLGLDLLIEKPMGVNTAQAQQIVEEAARLGRRVYVGCVLRFSDSLNTFRSLLPQVGSLHSVRIECQSFLPDWRPSRPYREAYSARAQEGGVLRDLIHEIDYAGWIFGWPTAVQARVENLGTLGIEADEMVEISWRTESGCLFSLHLDYLTRPHRRKMRAYGSHGTLEWDGITGRVLWADGRSDSQERLSSQSRDEMFLEQDCAFLNAVRGVWDPRLTPGEDGVKALAVCDAARRASATKREGKVR